MRQHGGLHYYGHISPTPFPVGEYISTLVILGSAM